MDLTYIINSSFVYKRNSKSYNAFIELAKIRDKLPKRIIVNYS